ncbi:hypothetical protein DFH06DRAFT_714311 [Mycena polygramma]|nr:hypothetical protein DFH06DRAFT_714311 [Mycena polygramma]
MMEVQELVDLTIDFLSDSRGDLKCCALVNKRWLPSAQHHLFSYFVLQSETDCQRLSNMLQELPWVHPMIAHLAVALNPWDRVAYGTLSNIVLTNLRKLSIYRFPSDSSGLSTIQDLCSLPSIAHISIMRHKDLVRQSSLFLRRTAHLGTLEIGRRCHNDHYNSDEPLSPIPSTTTRFTVDFLDIRENNNDRLRFTRPPQPLETLNSVIDLSQLTRLAVHDCGIAERLNYLLQYGTSISDLEIHGTIGDTLSFGKQLSIGPTSLPFLTHFTFHVLAPSALREVPLLLAKFTPESRLRTVTLAVSRDCAPTAAPFPHAALWSSVDGAVACLPLVYLTVKVSLTSYGVIESELGVPALRQYLACLEASARLYVVATQVYDPIY